MGAFFKILALGDIVGKPGREVIVKRLPELREKEEVDFAIGNAENVAGGNGLTPDLAEKLFASGMDCLTNGDHVWNKRELIPAIQKDRRLLRPANYPEEQPGRGWAVYETPKGPVGILNVQGRVFMGTPAECPFKTAERALQELCARAKVIAVDVHAEATSEKIAMGRYLDGRASCVFGTHTHVQTADEQVLPKGTGYITELGMTGPYDSVLGRSVEPVLGKFLTGMPHVFDVAEGDPRMSGCLFTIDGATGRCTEAKRIHIRL